MRRLAVGLGACLWAAALGLGGTEVYTLSAVQFVVLTLATGLLWTQRRNPEPPARLPWSVPALLLALVFAQHVLLAREGYAVQAHLPRLVTYLAVFLLAVRIGQHADARRWLLAALLLLGVLESLYGMVQYLADWHRIFTLEKVYYIAHATGTYVNPNHFSGLLEMILPLAVAAALYHWERGSLRNALRPKQSDAREGEMLARACFFSVLAALLLTAILFSRSRMGLLSAVAGTGAVALAWLISTPYRRRAAAVLAVLLMAVAGLGVWIGLGPVFERFAQLEADTIPRLHVWHDAGTLLRAHPWLGSGFGSFADVYPQVQTALPGKIIEHAHNDYLQAAVELGLPAALLLFAAIAVLVLRGWLAGLFRSPGSPERFELLGCAAGGLALLVHSAADFNLQLPANAMLFATLLGILAALVAPADFQAWSRPT
ncbi:MAG: O-antigen ligase family protein [Firmicutes bacterium]|nr:O-antigen ligase family protein [Bacillota bacterium]